MPFVITANHKNTYGRLSRYANPGLMEKEAGYDGTKDTIELKVVSSDQINRVIGFVVAAAGTVVFLIAIGEKRLKGDKKKMKFG